MKKVANILCISVLLGAAFVAGGRFSHKGPGAGAAAPMHRILYYACPMHPSLRADHPGDCMACGMKLDPVYNQPVVQTAAARNLARPLPPGSVRVSSDRQQVIGVKVAAVKEASRARTLRTTGRVAIDEARTYRLISGMEGRVMRVLPGATGDIVRKGQLLAVTSYLPNFLIAQQTYVSALNTADRYKEAEAAPEPVSPFKPTPAGQTNAAGNPAIMSQTMSSGVVRRPGGAPGGTAPGKWRLPPASSQSAFADYIRTGAQVKTTRETLLTMGMGETQVDELARTRKLADNVEMRAPADSVIVGRSIYPEQKFDKGIEFYRLADLSHVWILADINGDEGKYLTPGKRVAISIPNQSGTFRARVSDAVPQFDEAARILRVRLEVDNPRYALKPGMFLDVQVPMRAEPGLAVPADAILDSGLRKIVFVEHGGGVFEPRTVETGWRSGDQVQIKHGLHRGERIVVSGNFLLDSESRMRQTAAEPQAKAHHGSAKRM